LEVQNKHHQAIPPSKLEIQNKQVGDLQQVGYLRYAATLWWASEILIPVGHLYVH